MKNSSGRLKFISLISVVLLVLPGICCAQAMEMNVFNASLSASEHADTASGQTFRDCDVCPNKAGHAVATELPQLAKRCDTCTDTDVMGTETDAIQMEPDFSDYTDPAIDSPESLKPF